MTKAAKDLFVPEKLPQWFKNLPEHALLSGRDMLSMFGFKDTDSFVRSKCFPKPDKVVKGFNNEKALWTKKTVLKEIKRRKRVNAGEEQHATIREDLHTKVVEDISGVTHIGRLPCVCKELPEWYLSEDDYKAPETQSSHLRHEILWRYELNSKLTKQLEADFKQPNWDDIQVFMASELFNHPYAVGFQNSLNANMPYTGLNQSNETSFDETQPSIANQLSLLPTDYQADYAHSNLHNIEALSEFIQQKIQHPYSDDGTVISPDEQLNFRNFAQHIDDLHTKFITKVANHYKTAQLTPVIVKESPLEESAQSNILSLNKENKHHPEVTSGKSGVFTLICITIIICLIGYYFGL